MTDDPVAVWREAVNDEQHPRHRAAWLLFDDAMNVKFAASRLDEQKEQVIEWLYEILDMPELYLQTSLGEGYAPVNAFALLGQWHVTEAAPRLLKYLVEKQEDWDTHAYTSVTRALERMGPGVIEPLLEISANADEGLKATVAGILADVSEGDARVFQYLRGLFEQQRDQFDIEYMAENLLTCDPNAGAAYLESVIKQPKYVKARPRIEQFIQQVREGRFVSPDED